MAISRLSPISIPRFHAVWYDRPMPLLPRRPFGTASDQYFKIHQVAFGHGDPVRVTEPMITDLPHRVGAIGRPYRRRLARRLATAGGLKQQGVQLVRGKIALRGAWSPDWLLIRGRVIIAVIEVKGGSANLNGHYCVSCHLWLSQFEAYLATHLVACGLLLDGWRTACAVRHVLVADALTFEDLPENQQPLDLKAAKQSWRVVSKDVLLDTAPEEEFGQLMDEMITAHYKGEVLERTGPALLSVTGLPPKPAPQRRIRGRTLRASLLDWQEEGMAVHNLRGEGYWNDLVVTYKGRSVGVRTAVNPVRAWVLAEVAGEVPATEHVKVDGVSAPLVRLGDRNHHDLIRLQIRALLGLGIGTEDAQSAA